MAKPLTATPVIKGDAAAGLVELPIKVRTSVCNDMFCIDVATELHDFIPILQPCRETFRISEHVEREIKLPIAQRAKNFAQAV